MKYFPVFALFSIVFLSSCFRNKGPHEYKPPHPVQIAYVEKSSLYKQSIFEIKVDSLENELVIRFKVSEDMRYFSFLKSTEGDQLSYTTFSFTLRKNGVPVENPVLMHNSKHGYYNYTKWVSGPFVMLTDTFDLKSPAGYYTSFHIPFYALNTLKTGLNQLELTGSQTMFCSDIKTSRKDFKVDTLSHDTVFRTYRNITKAGLFNFKIRFNINVPAIYKTTLCGYGITLRNDSTYSPAGMDHTLWNSSYPDVYWSVSYPGNNNYCNSDYQKSTDTYELLDTFQLFHYYPNDTIVISVMDHDDLSRDDCISWKRFGLSQFPNNRQCKLVFDNIKHFGLKAQHWGVINKNGR